ncbi:MAG: TetR/AcrR family transcriptional regulator [Dokdonella sp.]|uniref:TetR/AcrR family transcriptional regulator n=1 Tax=Dokdonella sp. TaxID=2291710 RepID=UPI0032666AC1
MRIARKPGRPLSFDRNIALDQAMRLFWQSGYEGTSLGALTKAMGVTAPSIYAAFGDKKQLFLEAVSRYVSGPVTAQTLIDDAPDAHAAATALLRTSAIGFTGASTPRGCLLATSTISCSPAAADVQRQLAVIRKKIEARIKEKIADDVRKGVLPSGVDADALAGFVMATIQGLSTLARDGARREKILRVAEAAMAAWPHR